MNPQDIAINRPLLPWDRELQDPSWRRWFDTLKAQGVTGLADNSVGAKRGMFAPALRGLQQAVRPETQDLKQKRINYQLGRR